MGTDVVTESRTGTDKISPELARQAREIGQGLAGCRFEQPIIWWEREEQILAGIRDMDELRAFHALVLAALREAVHGPTIIAEPSWGPSIGELR